MSERRDSDSAEHTESKSWRSFTPKRTLTFDTIDAPKNLQVANIERGDAKRIEIMVETRQKPHDDADSDSEDEEEEQLQKVEINASKLTPLSPEVISKQVRLRNISRSPYYLMKLLGDDKSWYGGC